MSADPAFLATLQDGDKAILYTTGNSSWRQWTRQVVTVRLTATQVVAHGVRFRKSDGRLLGESCFCHKLLPYTEEEVLAIRRQRLNADILHMMRSALPEEVAQLSDEEAVQLEEALRKAGLSRGRFEGRHA